jgi:hypothetical protein
MKIKRSIQKQIEKVSKKIGVISIMGPRQSGKTTLAKMMFPKHKYYNLEDFRLRAQIQEDPKGFIEKHGSGVILDEVQKYPELLSYIQINVDENFEPSKFILTGSANLLLSEKVSQSLAGRVSIFHLLPLSIDELISSNNLKTDYFEQILFGFYPRIYDQNLEPRDVYPDYISTYIERDVRQIKNIGDLKNFQRFLQLLAGRTGQILNLSSIANDVSVTYKTIESWLSILESTYIAYTLQPYYENFGKRIIKSPKVYFYDTGLLCYLLGIDSVKELDTHPLIGNIYENLIVSDIKKQLFNLRSSSQMYFWRDSEKNEIDVLIKNGSKYYPIEIKAGSSFSSDYLKGIKVWNSLNNNSEQSYIVYNGENDKVSKIKMLNWKSIINIKSLV